MVECEVVDMFLEKNYTKKYGEILLARVRYNLFGKKLDQKDCEFPAPGPFAILLIYVYCVMLKWIITLDKKEK